MASRSGTRSRQPIVPAVVTTPAVSIESLIVNGTPWSGPTGSPRARASSAARARSRASAASRTTALIRGFTASIRARQASTTSRDETSRAEMARASHVADRDQSSSVTRAP